MNALLRSRAASSLLVTFATFAALAVSAGCGDDKKTQAADADAGAAEATKKPVLSGKLGAAVKAAESAQASQSKSGGGGDGPPEMGVFAKGAADKALAPGAPPKIEVLGDGNEPRVLLAPAPTDDEQKVTAGVVVRIQNAAIPVDYVLSLKVEKQKDKDKKDAPTRGARVAGKITQVSLPPQLPRDLTDKLAKAKGTEVSYVIAPDGSATDVRATLAKDLDPLAELSVKGLTDAISIALPPLPQRPVGAGGYWMVIDRASIFGVEVVRYRVYHVEKIDKDRASLTVDVRQYAAREEADLGQLAQNQKIALEAFQSTGKGKVAWVAAGLLPSLTETSIRTGLQGHTGDQKNAMLQAEVSAKVEAGKADKAK